MSLDEHPHLNDRLRARRTSLSQVPLIDLAPFCDGAGDRGATVKALRAALTDIGFLYVKNHCVPQSVIDRAFQMSRRFFDLPQAEKDALSVRQSGVAMHGYTPLFGENTDPDRTRDLKEIFDLGREAADGQVRPFFGPVPWPESLPDYRGTMMTYHDAMLGLARRIMGAIALSLDLPQAYFEPMMEEPIGIQRMLHYPPQDKVEDDSLIGIGAHTDYGCLTILAQDQVGGLQVMNRDGDWIDAPYVPGTFIINIGDMLQRLTNDLYIANLHRVINVSGRERYSIPFFFDVDFDTVFAPLPQCTGPDNPPRYDPIVCGQHKWNRYLATFPHLREGKANAPAKVAGLETVSPAG